MVDYKPQFKPIYCFGKNSSSSKKLLVDRINSFCDKISSVYYDSFKDKSWREIRNDFAVTNHNDIKDIINHVVEGKSIYASISVGVGVGIIANFTGAYIADNLGGSHKVIETASLASELFFHAVGYAGTYMLISKAEGKSRAEIYKGLVKTTIVALPISMVPYPLVRNPLAGAYMNGGIRPEWATVLSQATLLPFYARTVKFAVKRFGPRIEKYLSSKNYFIKTKQKNPALQNDLKSSNLDEIIGTRDEK